MEAEPESTWEETDRGLIRKDSSMKTTNQKIRGIIEASNLIDDALTSIADNPRSVKVSFRPNRQPLPSRELEDYQRAAYDIAKARGMKIKVEIDNGKRWLTITSE